MRVAPEIVLTRDERAELTRLKQSKLGSGRLAQRARIVLLAAKDMQNKDIALELNIGRVQVARWRERYAHFRLAGIERDLPRGAPPSAVDVARLARMTRQPGPGAGKTWSARSMAAALDISAASVSRHWRANGLKPQVPRGAEPSTDAMFSAEPDDIVGLYLSPPEHALVLCRDGAKQASAPDPAQPAPTRMKGRTASAQRKDRPNDFAGLLAALKALEGTVVAPGQTRQRHVPWLKFLRRVDRETPKNMTLHLIADNGAAHRHPAVREWLAKHKRFNLRFAPAAAPWLSAVERFFRDVTDRPLRHGLFTSAPKLAAGIEDLIDRPEADPGPFIWTRGGGDIRAGSTRAVSRLSPGKHVTTYANRTRTVSTQEQESGESDTLRDKVLTLKRDRILQVAAKLFFERGYLQTSVDAIAEHLGATKPFVYYHFQSKSDILVEICERSTRGALAAAENAMSTKDSPRVRFERFLREFTNVALKEHQLVAIYFREEISLPVEASERINQMRKSVDRRLSALLSEGIDTGDFQIEDPRIGALVIAGMSSYAFAWYREHGRLGQQEVTDRIVSMALKLVSVPPPHRPEPRSRSVHGV